VEIADCTRFIEVMQYLSLNFPERKVVPNLSRSYFRDLSEFGIEAVEEAAKTYVKNGDKFPHISDLIRILSA
jgi:hypothetical protein